MAGGVEVLVERTMECLDVAKRREKLAAEGGEAESIHRNVAAYARARADRFAQLAGWRDAAALSLDVTGA